MAERVVVAGAPGELALPLWRRLIAAGHEPAVLLAAADELAGREAADDEADAVRRWTRSADVLATVAGGLADDRPDALLVFPWWPPGGLRRRGERRRVLDQATELVEAAIEADIERVVVWGSAGVYRASDGTPSRERDALGEIGRWAEAAELESRLDRLGTTAGVRFYRFRAVPVVGSAAASWLEPLREARALPRISRGSPFQFLHVQDAVGVLLRALGEGQPGLYNVAGDGLITWSELCRALGRSAVPAPGASAGLLLGAGRAAGPSALSAGEQLVTPRIVDPTRLKTHFGYRPVHSGRQALREARDAGRRSDTR